MAGLDIGAVIGGRFEIEARVGAGGMGIVYRARDGEQGGSPVALKVLRDKSLGSSQRFEREVAILGRLGHPGIVGLVAHGVTDGGAPYLAMEWVEGDTLARAARGDGLTAAEVVRVGRAMAEALGAAHAAGVVHRDVKPSNVLLGGGSVDAVKLIDFGLARHADRADGFTKTGTIMGTPGYMAPEQACGETDLDGRVDVFALGCVLYELLAGRPAFTGDHLMALRTKVLLSEPPALRSLCAHVSDELGAVVHRALAKEPAQRFADGGAVAAALAALPAQDDAVRQKRVAAATAPTVRELPATALDSEDGAALRLVFAVLAADDDETGATRVVRGPTPVDIAERHGGRLARMVDDSLVIVLDRDESPSDLALRAARCGLELRAQLPDAAMVIAAQRGELATVVDALIDRGVAELGDEAIAAALGDAPDGIRLDATACALLERGADIVAEGRARYLRELKESA